MFSAKEAREQSNRANMKRAQEFLWNEGSKEIQTAIDNGHYNCVLNISNLKYPEWIGPFIAQILKENYGFEADYVNSYQDDTNHYIFVDWYERPKEVGLA